MKFILLIFVLCSALRAEWYQHYQEITDPRAKNYTLLALGHAVKSFHQPAIKVNEVYLYRSKLNAKPYHLSSADILDWALLQKKLRAHQALKLRFQQNFFESHLLVKKELAFIEKQKLIKQFNSLIDDTTFNKVLTDLDLEGEEKGWAGKGLWGWLNKDLKRLNRRLITKVLAGAVRPYTKVKGRVREGIQLCEVFDKERGVFIIYLTRDPSEEGFYDELGHEAFHLLNARDKDWLIEGVATAFSQDLARRQGKSWDAWLKLFKERPKSLYAQSYQLALKLKALGANFKSLKNCRVQYDNDYYAIDLKQWLMTQTETKRVKIKQVLSEYLDRFEDSDKAFLLE